MPMEKMFRILEKGGEGSEADNLNETPREAPPEAEEADNPNEAPDSHIEYVFTEKRFVAYFYQIIC